MFKKNKPYEATEIDIITDSKFYNIPMDIVRIIYSQNKVCHTILGNEYSEKYTSDEYQKMLMGASIAYNNQQLMGRVIPNDNPRAMDVNRYLRMNNVAIQYHPQHGMVLCDLSNNRNYVSEISDTKK
jgi:hypothetical protein